jgi:SAM-dependent methyltransferase
MTDVPTQSLATEYSGNAIAYAERWAPVIRPMAKPIFGALPLATAERILDVGAGTGSTLQDFKSIAPNAVTAGLDRAEGMLRVARGAGWKTTAVTDAQQLSVRSDSIDVALLIFMLFHLPDPVKALKEMGRVLCPGGCAGIVVWGRDPGVPGASIWTEELNREEAAPDPRDPSVMQANLMNTPEKLRDVIRASGLSVHRIWGEEFRHQFTVEELLGIQLTCGVAARRCFNLSPEAKARCRERVTARLEKLSKDELEYRPEVLFAVAA